MPDLLYIVHISLYVPVCIVGRPMGIAHALLRCPYKVLIRQAFYPGGSLAFVFRKTKHFPALTCRVVGVAAIHAAFARHLHYDLVALAQRAFCKAQSSKASPAIVQGQNDNARHVIQRALVCMYKFYITTS